jgi:ABC-2 type transport system permease protein
MPRVLAVFPLIALIAVSAYCLGLLLAAFVLRAMGLRNVVGNITWMTVGLLAGAQVPVGFWPGWAQTAAHLLPARHGLAAVRALLDGGPATQVLTGAALELAVAAGWPVLAILAFRHLAEGGRQDGSIEFTD